MAPKSRPHLNTRAGQYLDAYKIGAICFVLIGFWLRLQGLFENSFHSDEALFATWAREIAIWRDPLLRSVADPVDKPPLLFYAQAFFYPMLGPLTWAARMPNLITGILLIPLVGRIAKRLRPDLFFLLLAFSLVTFSPIAISFSASAFTDMLLTFWITLSIWAGLQGLPRWGLWLGLGLLTKYQAILFFPLLIVLIVLVWNQANSRSIFSASFIRSLVSGIGYFLLCGVLLLFWDWVNGGGVNLASSQISGFGGLRMIRSWELRPRAQAIFSLLQYLYIVPVLIILLTAGLYAAFRLNKARLQTERSVFNLVLFLFILGYLSFHWLVAVLPADRYYLPLVPIGTLLITSLFWGDGSKQSPRLQRFKEITVVVCIGVSLAQSFALVANPTPVGGRIDADGGASKIAAYLAEEPYGTVLYDHWYSWQWRYHLFDKKVFVSWFPYPDALVEDVTVFYSESPEAFHRFVALPNDERAFIPSAMLNEAGFDLELIAVEDRIALYLIVPIRE